MLFAEQWVMAGVPEHHEGVPYDPYDEQRILEMEDHEDCAGGDVIDDSILNSSTEEPRYEEAPVQPVPVPAPVADPHATPGNPAEPGTSSSTPQTTGTHTRSAVVPESSANLFSETKNTCASTTHSAHITSDYLANKHCTKIRNGAPNIHDKADMFRVETGSFFNEGDNRFENGWLVYDNVNKLNICYSFDPKNLHCKCCNGLATKKTAFVLADQNFPAVLPSCEGEGACLKIIRIEGGSLSDLATLFLNLFKNKKVPPGSVILLGSATCLATVGMSGYAEEFVEASLRIGTVLDKTSVVAAVPMLLLNGSEDPTLIRNVVEISAWFEKIFEKVAGFPAEAHKAVIECLAACGTDGFQGSYSVRARLPCNRLSKSKTTWSCPCLVSLPEKLVPLPLEFESKIIKLMLMELNRSMALDLDPSTNQTRMVEKKSVAGGPDSSTYVVVGSSHAKRTAAALVKLGEDVRDVIVPAWRPTSAQVDNIKQKLEGAVVGLAGNIIVVFEMFDNCYYYAQCDDGSLIPARRGHDGRYHVDGESVLAPKETQFALFKKLLPVLNAVKGAKRVLVPPLPRYLHRSCCEDPEHIPNIRKEDYKEALISATYDARSNIKDFAFRLGLRETRTVSPWQSIKRLDNIWGEDPVHMAEAAYVEVAKLVKEAAAELAKKRKPGEQALPDGKRPKVEACPGRNNARSGPSHNNNSGNRQPTQQDGVWYPRGQHQIRGARGRAHSRGWPRTHRGRSW